LKWFHIDAPLARETSFLTQQSPHWILKGIALFAQQFLILQSFSYPQGL